MQNAAVAERPALSTIGRYELLREIARGGMAVLYLARELGIQGFEKLVVVKRILPELAGRKDMLAMFLDEARIAALLQHANLPHTYELVHQDGEYVFAMEYLHGVDVRALVKAVPLLPLEHAISIAIGLCAGLHYAHERRTNDGMPMNLVHRDVSPRNLFVTYDGNVKLLDFGIAQAEQNQSQTQTGTLKGTIRYMSPEQIHAERIDRRSDVFAASIVLWELTVGRPLFTGSSDYSVMTSIAEREAAPPSTVRADYPTALDAIVMKGLQRRPEDRFQTAEELQLALEDFARTHQLATSSVGLARFMRETFRDEVEAYQEAREHGTLTARAIEEVATRSREPDEVSAVPAKRTRLVAHDTGSRRSWRTWAVAAGAVAAIGSAIVWWQLSARPASSPPAPPAPPPAPPMAQAPPPLPPPSPPPPTATTTHPVSSTPRPTATKKHVRAKPVTGKKLTNEDLDAAFPPK